MQKTKNFDCAYCGDESTCRVLTGAVCKMQRCSFYKSAAEIDAQNKAWRQKLSALESDVQQKIAKKYYGGALPWKEE